MAVYIVVGHIGTKSHLATTTSYRTINGASRVHDVRTTWCGLRFDRRAKRTKFEPLHIGGTPLTCAACIDRLTQRQPRNEGDGS